MARISVRLKQSGLTAKLTIPFVVVFVAALGFLGTMSVRGSRAALLGSLDKRAEILVTTLATTLGDPLSMGELDRLQQLLTEAKGADPDVAYAILINMEGKAVASTDTSLKNQVLTRNDFEKAMGQVTAFTRRPVPGLGHVFEAATPVKFQGNPAGILRIGVSRQQVEAMAVRAAWSIAGVGLLALVFGVAVYMYVARRVARPLRQAVDRLRELASGDADLTRRLEVTSRDEIGQLASALNTFLDNLHGLVQEIQQTSFQVTSASQQLSAATERLSGGAQQQASSLEETAASLEEITGTVKQNADNARQANQLALGSRATAETGGQVVTTAVGAMGEINKASKKIADIITTIDEIAFQTNLLALNAAVEAARAGEQGRGFAVVAAEVRNLAQRSAGAAREIKDLIEDSVGKVEAGSELVTQSGKTLQEIVASVKRVTDIIAEIAAASQEQSTGIDQVNKAVMQMDIVVQANASQTVQLRSTAQALASQAEQLQGLVARFKLDDHGASTPGAAPAPPPAGGKARPKPAAGGPAPRPAARPMEPALAGAHAADGFEDF